MTSENGPTTDTTGTAPADGGPLARALQWFRDPEAKHRVGTLAYTNLGLFTIFFWILWGDLIFTLMEAVFPPSMPLQLSRLGIPNQWVIWIMGALGNTVNTVMGPLIGYRSDRTRSRWGRRIPYILASMPFLCLLLIACGFTDSIGAAIRASHWPHACTSRT